MSEEQLEDLEAFRARARAFVRENLRHVGPTTKPWRNVCSDEEELVGVGRDREIQRMLFDAGLAGICVPREYGGQGLTPAHQQVLRDEFEGYEYPSRLQSPTFSPITGVLLEFGSEAQKLRHIPAILKGEEIWMQFLSEPSGGSDVAGALSTAVRDGDEWILNGSKIWTTGAWWSDWGLCLARTNWDVPKHRGLTVFMLPLHQPGIEVHRIEMLNGNREFCQEFMTDVRIPDSDRVGDVDQGWTVGTRWMYHERMLFNSPFTSIPTGSGFGASGGGSALSIARQAGRGDDPVARDLIGESRTLVLVREALERRIGEAMRARVMSDQASAIGRLFSAISVMRTSTITFELAGAFGGAWVDGDGNLADCGTDFLMRQAACIGGGTTEMARNVVSERVLGMPRELSPDRDVAFRDVPRGPSAHT
jgi:alkylation response protein AidB-like acyl-CoA dehydrogenase